MEYLKPMEVLKESLKKSQFIIIILSVLLLLSILGVPLILRQGPYVVIDDNSFQRVIKSNPQSLSISRVEGFLKYYLSLRFEWNKETLNEKIKNLEFIVQPKTFQKLSENIKNGKYLSENQEAKSFFILEDYRFSQSNNIIEANITRVLRIKNAALSTPLKIKIIFLDSNINKENPYGIMIDGIEEAPLSSLDNKITNGGGK